MSEAEFPEAAHQMGKKVEELKLTTDKTAVSFDARKSRTLMKILGRGERADCAMT